MQHRILPLPALALLALGACGDSETDSKVGQQGLPCDVAAVLTQHCQGCHGDKLAFGATMPLVDHADLLAKPPSEGARSVIEAALSRVQDDQRPMPPRGNPRLNAAEIATLRAWFEGGTQGRAADESCPDLGQPGKILEQTEAPEDCENFYDFLAHGKGAANDTTPFDVSAATSGDLYECFNFKVPWGEDPLQGLYFAPLPDDERVLHHYILYGIENATDLQDGSIGCGESTGRLRMEGWAPGRGPSVMPAGIGYEMPRGPNAFIQLEIHYNNTAGHKDARDRSGVRLCTTSKLRAQTAASHWLGTERIQIPPMAKTDVVGNCEPAETATIIRVGPHMHLRGVHMKTLIERADGTQQVLLDQPFEFSNQIQYDIDPPVVVGPGDKLTTTCSYEDTDGKGASFGPNTENEMCYNFVTAYPSGALVSSGVSGSFGSLVAKNRCISLF